MKKRINPKSILITGASSGIGASLAHFYANTGVHLFLGGRDSKRLASVASQCSEKGANVEIMVGNVSDEKSMRDWVIQSDKIAPLNLVVANAGEAGAANKIDELHETAVNSLNSNVLGIFNVVHPAIERMALRGPVVSDGQIAIMSSIMGYIGVARSPAYSYSKGTARLYGQALRGALRRTGISVSVICPGYVDTPMNRYNRSPMPFIVSSQKAARIIARGLSKNQGRITFPWQIRLIGRMLSILPNSVLDYINIPWGRPPLKASSD